jgi:hypothetical protein
MTAKRTSGLFAAVAAVLILAGSGPAAALGTTAPPPARLCKPGAAMLSAKAVRALLRGQGYFSIRALRFRRFEASTRRGDTSTHRGAYLATASRGFGIVRWRLSIDPCSGRILRTPAPRQPQRS